MEEEKVSPYEEELHKGLLRHALIRKGFATSANYLEKIPARKEGIDWDKNDENKVTLHIKNEGFMNKVAQKLFKKPEVSHIYLDEMGSFVWPILDGKMDIIAIGKLVKAEFGEKAEPLYERLAKYFQILDSYGFVEWR